MTLLILTVLLIVSRRNMLKTLFLFLRSLHDCCVSSYFKMLLSFYFSAGDNCDIDRGEPGPPGPSGLQGEVGQKGD